MPKNSKLTPKVRKRFPGSDVQTALSKLADFLLKNFDFSQTGPVLIGIHTRGALLARRLAGLIKAKKGVEAPVGEIDITLYRDDFSTTGVQPVVGETTLDFDIDNSRIVLIDDVLFTGRTIRAALDELMDYGRPTSVTLAVLIDRGHRELPIEPKFAAITLATKRDESVILRLKEQDGADEILICEPLEMEK